MTRTLFVLGDSISIHYGPYLKQMLDGQFAYDRKRGDEALANLDRPAGANGGDSRQVLAFLDEQRAQAAHHDVLLLNCGLHDLRTDPQTGEKQVPLEEYEQNLQRILTLAEDLASLAVWVRTTPVDDERHNRLRSTFWRYNRDVVTYNNVADGVMQGSGVPTIDLYTFTRTLGDGVYCDHVHFAEEMRALQAAFIAGHLCSLAHAGTTPRHDGSDGPAQHTRWDA